MKIAVFGGSGRTGQHVVRKALADGHEVIALARAPEKLAIASEKLTIIPGDAADKSAVVQTITGADGVISALTPSQTAIDNILEAMAGAGVRRIIVTCGAGVYRPGDDPPMSSKIISWIIKTFSGAAFAASTAVADALPGSPSDWTLVRAPRLVNKPATNSLYVGPLTKEMKTTLSREDYANFLVAALTDGSLIGQTPVVSDK